MKETTPKTSGKPTLKGGVADTTPKTGTRPSIPSRGQSDNTSKGTYKK